MNTPLLSIVIPCYNSERYLRKCILSAAEQQIDGEEFEVIIVNDGSTDGSLAIAEELAVQFPCIHIVSQANQGVGIARNTGIDHASGKYVLFMDSDDYIEVGALQCIANRLRETGNPDILGYNLNRWDPNGNRLPDNSYVARLHDCPREAMRGRDFLLDNHYLVMVYLFAFRRDFLHRHALRMPGTWHEDTYFVMLSLYHAARVQYVDEKLYNYIERTDSFSHSYHPSWFFGQFAVMASLARFADRIAGHDPEAAFYFRTFVRAQIKHGIDLSTHAIKNRSILLQLLNRCRDLQLIPHFASPKWLILRKSPALYLYLRKVL